MQRMIFALDLGIRAGFASGVANQTRPDSGTVVLKRPNEHRSVAFSNLICFLNEKWSKDRPSLVVKETMLPLQAFRNLENAQHTVQMTSGLHAITEAMCVRFGIDFKDVADSTIRKHFIGRAKCGTRADTKAAVVRRCQLLALMPRECGDDNRADAIATWSWAVAVHSGRAAALHLFGEAA